MQPYNGGAPARPSRNYDLQEFNLLPSAARTATTTSASFTKDNFASIVIVLDVTTNPGGAETLTLSLKAKPFTPAAYLNMLSSAAQAGGGSAFTMVMQVGPMAVTSWSGGTGNSKAQMHLANTMQVVVTHSASGSWTYTVDVLLTMN